MKKPPLHLVDKRPPHSVPPAPVPAVDGGARATTTQAPALSVTRLGKAPRLPQQLSYAPPKGSKPLVNGGFNSVVPVSAVAAHWGISARRVRMMLEQGRLAGQKLDNGFWEVFYPYRYVLGTRGPAIKRQRNLPPAPRRWPEGFTKRSWMEHKAEHPEIFGGRSNENDEY